MTPGSIALIGSLDAHPGPVIVALSHASWWDPLVVVVVARALLRSRSGCAPMERAQLEKFSFFRRLGMFGVDPDDAAMLTAMSAYVRERFEREARPTLFITPQGRFADPRTRLEVRPGVAAIAAAHASCRVVCLAIEYPFWSDQRPEVLLHAREAVLDPSRSVSTSRWHQAIAGALGAAMGELAVLAMARDPRAFAFVVGRGAGSARVNPVYDLWLKLRGRGSGAIESSRVPGTTGSSVDFRSRESGETRSANEAGT